MLSLTKTYLVPLIDKFPCCKYSHETRNVTIKNVGHQVDELTTVTFKEQCQAIFSNSYTYKYCTKKKK